LDTSKIRRHVSAKIASRLFLLLVIILGVGLAGCSRGKSKASAREKKETQTLEIALDYGQDYDLQRAEDRLKELKVGNRAQWVAMLAERNITDGGDRVVSDSLSVLAKDLGIFSEKMAAYLVPPTVPPTASPTSPPAPTIAPTATVAPTDTVVPATPEPTATPVPPTPTTVPATSTPTPKPEIVVLGNVNVRSGPSTLYPVLGRLEQGQQFEIVARNDMGDWWQICCLAGSEGWVVGELVDTVGPAEAVAVAGNIPAPPPTPTPAPPTATPEPTRPPIDFIVASVRLWGVEENGGWFDGPSVHCGEKRQLRVIVQDASGAPLNGVAVHGIYSKVTQATGDKGPGTTQFVLGGGDAVKVVKDVDGRDASSEEAHGLTTDPATISDDHLMAAGYCTDPASCAAHRVEGCRGHYSWDVVFKRTY